MAELGGLLASAVLKILTKKICSAISDQTKLLWDFSDDLEEMKMTLESVAALLNDAERRSMEEETVRIWLKRLKDAMYSIDNMIDEFEDGTIPAASKLATIIPCMSIGPKIKMANEMKRMRGNLEKITKQHKDFTFATGITSNIQQHFDRRETSSAVEEALIIGRKEEKRRIMSILSENMTEKITILPIYGFGGIGKTTLAKLVFNDALFCDYSRVWVFVSQVFCLKTIGNSIISQVSNSDSHMSERQMINNRLEELLAGRKILIVLDDLWEDNTSRLDDLMSMLNLGEGSNVVVIVTTRDEDIAEKFRTLRPHKLAPMTNDMCWTIVKQKSAFESRDDKKQLERIGMDIAMKCGGVALAAQSLGYMLRSMTFDEWKSVRDSDIWNISSSKYTSSPHQKVLSSLRLSYNSMPPCLRLCFGYCAMFPKGHDIIKDDLIRHWLSLGFIEAPGIFSTRQLSENYIRHLIGLSFLQPSKSLTAQLHHERHAIMFTMHDLVHDLARSVMVDEILDATAEGNTAGSSSRYAILNDCSKALELSTTCPAKIRTIRFLDCRRIELCGSAFSSAKSLRVLDLSECSIAKLPDSICRLKQLRYLNAPRIVHEIIPSCISKLSKLVYLNLSGSRMTELPESFVEIRGLLHLDISYCRWIQKLPESFEKLKNLEHLDLSNCCQLRDISKSLGGLTNIKHLNLSLGAQLGNMLPLEGLPEVIGDLKELRYLGLSRTMHSIIWDMSSSTDKRLSFIDCICTLSNLEHLDLSDNYSIISVPESIGNLRKLHTLDLSSCSQLQRLPECMAKMDSLKILNLDCCSKLDRSTLPESKMLALLPHFAVRADDGESNIGVLRHTYPNVLHISNLDNVKSAEEVQSIKLIEKRALYDLKLEWTMDARRYVEDVEVLAVLVPPRTLRKFDIKGYSSVNFPDWIMNITLYLPGLIKVVLWDLCSCNNLPPLGQLPNLQELVIRGSTGITKIEDSLCGGARAFPQLMKFRLCHMENLEAWNTINSNGEDGGKEFMFPNLVELVICDCPKLILKPGPPRAMEWEIENSDNVLSSWGEGRGTRGSSSGALKDMIVTVKSSMLPMDEWRLLHHLPAITELSIIRCTDMSCSSPQIIRELSSIRSLSLEGNGQAEVELPKWLGQLTSLLELEITNYLGLEAPLDRMKQLASLHCLCLNDCKSMTTLPQWLGQLISLQRLFIKGWTELSDLQQSMRHITLEVLCLNECPSISTLPEWLGDLAALKKLEISKCMGIKSLPESIQRLTNLEELHIRCPELAEWCEQDENKKKLAHITGKDIRYF